MMSKKEYELKQSKIKTDTSKVEKKIQSALDYGNTTVLFHGVLVTDKMKEIVTDKLKKLGWNPKWSIQKDSGYKGEMSYLKLELL